MLRDFMVKSNEKLKILLPTDIFHEKYPDFVNISWSTMASLIFGYAQQIFVEIHYRRVT